MAIWDKALDDVSEQDLIDLVINQVMEQRHLEYKSQLPAKRDEPKYEKDKVELKADTSSFANAAGGLIIYGMAAKRGIATDLCGVEVEDADKEILRLESTIQDGVAPRIPGLTSRALQIASGRHVILLRIQQSWASPHMVINGDDRRFYSRRSNGKYMLDIGEIRSAFLRSENFAAQVRRFRVDRLAKIEAGETPIPLLESAKLVLHLVPFSAFDPGRYLDLTPHHISSPILWSTHPVGTAVATQRYNFDGLLRYSDNSYVQIFRDGCIEAADAIIMRPFEGAHQIPSTIFERNLIRALRTYLDLERQLNVDTPLLVMLSLVGVRGYVMAVRATLFSAGPTHPIDRDTLVVPEELLETYDRPPEDILKRAFDTIWNAAGWSRSMNYDEDGNRLSNSD